MYKKSYVNFVLVIGVILTFLFASCAMNNVSGSGEAEKDGNPNEAVSFEQVKSQSQITDDGNPFENAVIQDELPGVVTTSEESRYTASNIAAGKPATGRSIYAPVFNASKAVDSIETTGWGSAASPNIQWFYVDLGSVYDIGHVVLKWFDKYYAAKYKIAHSLDGQNWTLLNAYTGTGGTEIWNFQHTSLQTRYVGVYLMEKNSFAYGIAEFEVYKKENEARHPFPQNQSAGYSYYNGCTAPFDFDKMNKDLVNIYRNWLKDHLAEYTMAGVTQPGYVILADGTGGPGFDYISQSEAHGYGMMILALMAGSGVLESMPEFGKSEKEYFDGMVRVYKNFPASDNQKMMWWAIPTDGVKTGRSASCATDGDFDMIYALLLADKQWGSTGTHNYKQLATDMITACFGNGAEKDHLIENINGLNWVKIGSWAQDWGTKWVYNNISRPSDWILYSFRSFASASTGTAAKWNTTISDVYKMYFGIVDNYSNGPGLLPDFVTGYKPVGDTKPTAYSPAYQGWWIEHEEDSTSDFFEGKADGYYYYNACRVPWRIGSDIVLYDIPDEYAVQTRLVKLARHFQYVDPQFVWDGYYLDGTMIPKSQMPDPVNDGVYGKKCFVAPIATAFLATDGYNGMDFTPQLQTYWDYMAGSEENQRYFSRTVNLLNMILISGNWWNPESK